MNIAERHKLWEQGIWVTKDAREIPVSEMDDFHLVSTLKFIVYGASKIAKTIETRRIQFDYYAENYDWESVAQDIIVRMPIWSHLVDELKVRGIIEGGDTDGLVRRISG